METAVQAINRDRYDDVDWQIILDSVGVILYRQGWYAVDDDVLRFLHYLGYETEDEFCRARGFTDLTDAFFQNGWFDDLRAFTEEIKPNTHPLLPALYTWERNTLLIAFPPKQTVHRDRYVQQGEAARRIVDAWLAD